VVLIWLLEGFVDFVGYVGMGVSCWVGVGDLFV